MGRSSLRQGLLLAAAVGGGGSPVVASSLSSRGVSSSTSMVPRIRDAARKALAAAGTARRPLSSAPAAAAGGGGGRTDGPAGTGVPPSRKRALGVGRRSGSTTAAAGWACWGLGAAGSGGRREAAAAACMGRGAWGGQQAVRFKSSFEEEEEEDDHPARKAQGERRRRQQHKGEDEDGEEDGRHEAASSSSRAGGGRGKAAAGKEEGGSSSSSKKASSRGPKVTAQDVLRQRQRKVCQLPANAPIEEAVRILSHNNAASCVVYDESKGSKSVVGMFTARDILKKLNKHEDKLAALKLPVKEMMTPMSRVIFCSPDESLEKIQYIMAEMKVRNLPVLSNGVIHGIITLGDVSDHYFSMEEIGGKKAFIKGVTGRLGLPSGTRVAPHVAAKEGVKRGLRFKVGMAALPHPFKRPDGVGANLRDHGPHNFSTDVSLSEDASFVLTTPWLHEHGDEVTYIGLADGVGSWREQGVDPREFSQTLMRKAQDFITSMTPKSPNLVTPVVRPLDVLSYAWEATCKEGVVGSSTACIATLDQELSQLSFCNVGDNGIIILRHIDSDIAGYMRDKTTPRPLRTNDLRIAFVSRQQLRSFNLPYQLGYTNAHASCSSSSMGGHGDDGGRSSNFFETPQDADNSSIPVMRGDVIIMATDGLYDNVELDEILSLTLAWEEKWFGQHSSHGDGHSASNFPDEAVQDLAWTLCKRARELSVDSVKDSPFALLAKENDIMWGGGMPDDCTIAVIRVVKAPPA